MNKQQRISALEAHRDRITPLYEEAFALSQTKQRGGEDDKVLKTKFWLIEAKTWIAEEKAKP